MGATAVVKSVVRVKGAGLDGRLVTICMQSETVAFRILYKANCLPKEPSMC